MPSHRIEGPRAARRPPARRASVLAVSAMLLLAACGSDDSPQGLAGVVRDPAPQVDLVALPSLSEPGTDIEFRAQPGGLQIVYFGFTNCPDVCPTTLADLTVALRKMDPADAALVDVVMVTVDPDRDLDVLDNYVTSFIADAEAAGTPDEDLLVEAATPFGATWDVRVVDDAVEVDHSGFLYAIDDQGELQVTWQFGASSDDMSNDMTLLLDRYDA